jgi:fatty-acyl-CoA synthase|tara:strand:- start:13452 stop:15041 length:1590 start_codon:yes stop_codon:yes gene_type:complete
MEVPMIVNDFLRRAVDLYGPKLAVVDDDKRFTYTDFAGRCHQLAHALSALGIGKGDRVGIVSPNSHHFLESFYGTSLLGAVLVPLNYRLLPSDFAYALNHAGASVVLADSDLCPAIDEIMAELSLVEHRVVARYRDAEVPDGWLDWEQLIAPQSTERPPDPLLDENDLVSINYTSGTTARPKGVMLTHRNFYINAYHFIAHFGISHDDVDLWTLPMFHCNGWGGVYALTSMGATHVIVRAPEAETVYSLIADEGVTFACMAPAVLARLLEHDDPAARTVATTPRIVCAGAPPPVALVQRLEEELGWTFMQLYGLTETAPILTVAEPKPHVPTQGSDLYRLKARAGHPGLGVDVRVVDDDGNDVEADDTAIGQVAVRGNMVFKGYWDQPEETEKVVIDGYFYTGDLATVDKHGYLQIVDRAKDVIISGGENVSSIEVEDVLYTHPDVLECAVVGVPSEKWGETPLAFVVARPGTTPTAAAIIDHCRDQMAHFKAPTSVEFVAEIPRTATGKIKKFELREPHWEGQGRRVS